MKLFLLLDSDTQLLILFELVRRSRHRPWNLSKIQILSEQQNHRCCYCGVRFIDPPYGMIKRRQIQRWRRRLNSKRKATIEHVIRICDGGQRVWENEVAACMRCNTNRQDTDAFIYCEHREAIMVSRKIQKKRRKQRKKVLVGMAGVEPATFCMSSKRSPAELHAL